MEGVLIRTKEEHEIHVIIWSRFSILLSKIICMHLALTKRAHAKVYFAFA